MQAPDSAQSSALLKQFLAGVTSSRAVSFWVDVRTFKTLYTSLQQLSREIYAKYIDAHSPDALDLPEKIRDEIREKALRNTEKLYLDTFDLAKNFITQSLELEISSPRGTALCAFRYLSTDMSSLMVIFF